MGILLGMRPWWWMDRSAEWQYGLNEKKLINDFEEYGILLLKIFHCKLKVVCPSRFENLKQTDYEQLLHSFYFLELKEKYNSHNNILIINLRCYLIQLQKFSRCENLIPPDEDKVSSLNSGIIESDNLSDTKSVTRLVTCSNLSRQR